SATFPMNPARAPSDASPATVLATDPPDRSTPPGARAWTTSADSRSMSCIEPFTRPHATTSATDASTSTSTSADPIPHTSRSGTAPTVAGPSGKNAPMAIDPYRLPTTVTPVHYELSIAPD